MVVNVKLAMSISDSEGEEGCVFGCWLAPRELGLWKVAWSWLSQGRGPLAGVIWQLTIFSDIYLMHMSISYPFKRLQTCASLAICSCHRVNEFGKPLSLRMRRAASLTKTRGSDQPTNHMLSRAGMSYPHFQGSFRPVWLQHTTPPFAPFAAVRGRKSTAVLHNAVVGFRDSSSSPSRGGQVLAELAPRMHACYDYALNPPCIFPGSLHARRH